MQALSKDVEFGNIKFQIKNRMHSSRMRTARRSSRLLGGGWAWRPPGCGPGDTPFQPDPSTSPLGVGLETLPPARSLNFPPGCGPGDPPQARPLNFPLGVGLETPSPARPLNLPPGCGPGDLQCMLGYHTPPPVERQTRVKT